MQATWPGVFRGEHGLIVGWRQSEPEPQLSRREIEVLRHVHTGLSNKQIARVMGISDKTVKAHLTNIFQRIGVLDRTQAARWFERQETSSPA